MKRRRMRSCRRTISPCRIHYRQKYNFCLCWMNKNFIFSLVLLLCFAHKHKKNIFSNQRQNILKTNSSTLWSICLQDVKFYAYAHVYVYVSCLPNLPNGRLVTVATQTQSVTRPV